MPTVKFIEANGREHVVNVKSGISAMRAAVDNGVPGIDGDCGGAMACGTCHVFVEPAWIEGTGRAEEKSEKPMLEFSLASSEFSRLSCQIVITDALDGLVLRLPEGQF